MGSAAGGKQMRPVSMILDLIRLTWPFSSRRTRGLVGLVLISLALATLSVVWPLATRRIVDSLVSASWPVFTISCAIILGVFVLQTALGYVSTLVMGRVTQDWTVRLRELCFWHHFRSSLAATSKIGDTLSTIITDSASVASLVIELATSIPASILVLVLAVATMMAINPELLAISISSAPVLALVYLRWAKSQRACSDRQREALGQLTGAAKDRIEKARVLTGLSGSTWVMDDIRNEIANYTSAILHRIRVSANLGVAASSVSLIAQAAILGYGGLLYFRGELTLGTLFAFTALFSRLNSPVSSLCGISSTVSLASASIRRVYLAVSKAPRLTNDLVLNDTTRKHLGNLRQLLKPGKVIGLVGPVGAGKSTLCLGLMLDYWSGADTIATVAYVPQNAVLPHSRIRDFLSHDGRGVSEEELFRVLSAVHLDARIRQCAEGLDTPIGPAGVELSAGETQKLLLARAFLTDWRLLILDETLSSLDEETALAILEVIIGAVHDRRGAALLVTHRPGEMRLLDQVYRLNQCDVVGERPGMRYRVMGGESNGSSVAPE